MAKDKEYICKVEQRYRDDVTHVKGEVYKCLEHRKVEGKYETIKLTCEPCAHYVVFADMERFNKFFKEKNMIHKVYNQLYEKCKAMEAENAELKKKLAATGMTRTEHLLSIVAEECAETAQRAIKILRFGLEEVQSGQELTNAQRLVYEFSDLFAVMKMLHEEGHLPAMVDELSAAQKKLKIEKWLKYSKEQGRLRDE